MPVFQNSVVRHAAAGLMGLVLGTLLFFVIAAGILLA